MIKYICIDKETKKVEHWLKNYVVKIDNSPLIYICAVALVLLIVVAAVMLQALSLMRANPAEALKKE